MKQAWYVMPSFGFFVEAVTSFTLRPEQTLLYIIICLSKELRLLHNGYLSTLSIFAITRDTFLE